MSERCMILDDKMKRCRRPAYVIIPVFTNGELYVYPSPLRGGVLTLVCRQHLMETDEDPKKARRVRYENRTFSDPSAKQDNATVSENRDIK